MSIVSQIKQQRQRSWREPGRNAAFIALVVLVVLLLVWGLAGRWYEARLMKEQRAEARAETSLRGNALSLAINRRLSRLQGLHAFVQVESPETNFQALFEPFANALYDGAQGIRYLAVAPGGTVRYVYPPEGNESLLGHDMLHDPRPQMWADTARAIEVRRAVATGPVALISGGEGLIARQPVYQGDALWGLVSLALDVSILLEEAGLSGGSGELEFALLDSEGQVFFGSDAILDRNPVLVRVQLSEETWELAGVQLEGWQSATRDASLIFRVGGFIIVVLVAGLSYLAASRQAWLADAVQRRTREISRINEQLQQDIVERRRAEAALAEREEQYRSVFESTSDGLFIFDLEGQLVDANPAACRMHGYSRADFGGLQPGGFIHPDSLSLFDDLIGTVRGGREFRGRGVHLRRDGTPFHVELDGVGFVYSGRPHALAVVRDVTEEVKAYQWLEQRVEERTRELATLLEASSTIASTLELQPLLGLILEQLGTVVEYTGASIFLRDGNELRSVAHQGPLAAEGAVKLHFSQEQAGELWAAMLHHRPVIIDDVCGDSSLAQALRRVMGPQLEAQLSYVRGWMGLPLTVQEHFAGWLVLHHSQPGAYTAHHAGLAQTIANQASTAIENAHLLAQTRRLAALEERQRLARELHDSVSQVLYGIGLGTRTALAYLHSEPGKAEQPMEYVLGLADAGLSEMRALIFELRPDSLEKDGLVVALDRQAAAVCARHGLVVETDLGEEPSLPLETKEALYRVAQEALNNVVKHAQAQRASVRLLEGDDEVLLEVQDDGLGFDPRQEFPGRMGLRSMQERVAELRGSLDIESGAARGTHLRARIPLA